MSTQVWITLSHSARPLDFSRSSRETLLARFASNHRLLSLPPFEDLDTSKAPNWPNNISVWAWNASSGAELISFIERGYTVNHALIKGSGESLVLCAHDHLELCSLDGSISEETTHNWFAGGHTVYYDESLNYVVACAASDAVLTFDSASLQMVSALRIPSELYGMNYALSLTDDVRKHYIHNDAQVAHINSAYPWHNSLIVTCFIQGAVVQIFPDGSYDELVSGFVGCHGAKVGIDGAIYFADSPRGEIVWLRENRTVASRLSCRSSWLHDVVWLHDDYYACAIGDRNQLVIIRTSDNREVQTIDLEKFGRTPCLLASGVC